MYEKKKPTAKKKNLPNKNLIVRNLLFFFSSVMCNVLKNVMLPKNQ